MGGISESKCDCRNCGERIAFPSDLAGQTVECPHCKSATQLYSPSEETSKFKSCACQHCSGEFEFDANSLFEENSLIQCPHCGQTTKAYVPEQISRVEPETPLITEIKTAPQADSITIFHNQDTLTLRGETVVIHKRGWANALASGMNGERTIQISSITAIQMKPAGMITLGYILFSYAGSKPFMGGILEATQDPDAFLFINKLNDQIADFKTKVELKMQEFKQQKEKNNKPDFSLADELKKLADFRQQGILTPEEFEAAKKKLLS